MEQRQVDTRQSRPTLVFLHYFGGAASSWNWIIRELESEYNCLALNLPGFGGLSGLPNPSLKAYADYVFKKFREAQIGNCVIIGHSMGGKIALQCTVDDAENRIEQLILVAPSPPSVERIPAEDQKEMKKDPDLAGAEEAVRKAVCIRLDAEKWSVAVATPQQVDPGARKWWIDEGTKHSIADQTKDLKIPIHLLLAEKDPAITTAMTSNDTLPNLSKDMIISKHPTSGHLIPLEDPAWLAEQILNVLD
ncbi:alpha/beta hydrolase [Pedobacter sp. MC2016-15]|uniref:alpha/beta fold hydrolase n=1 Tax=Pedobacter sp. MC2016-15 TaxID=2994473 RepID=UPI0022486645|nr:alpha/beta hydrolase [Pedobacter sp. MC2016-15]MCX2477702.1 alpha/beta hydrolase [Pedobacter sp. MC2016-15]